jgi:hypothetical protein
MAWLSMMRTYDPHEKDPELKKYGKSFPVDKPYFPIITDRWRKKRKYLIEKSRQRMISWWACSLHFKDAACKAYQYIYFRSQKKNDAGLLKDPLSLLSRIRFMEERLREDFKCFLWGNKYKPVDYFQGSEMGCTFPNGSTIICVSRNPDDIRNPTATHMYDDEDAFQEWKEEADRPVGALLGTTGKWLKVSTANGKGYFWRKLMDKE